MLVLASDHLIQNPHLYLDTMAQAVDVALDGDNLVIVGITFAYPESGYGYIHFARNDVQPERTGVYAVRRFVEKPDLATAKGYLASGEYLWNSGMFVWKTSSILSNFERLMPEVYNGLRTIEDSIGTDIHQDVLCRFFEKFSSISVDYGIMEKAENIYTLLPVAGTTWAVGLHLNALATLTQTAISYRAVCFVLTQETPPLSSSDKLIAAVGLEDTVVVDTADATLICRKEAAQYIKKLLNGYLLQAVAS